MQAHILVIDDDDNITNLLRRTLTYEGYTVATAHDAQEGFSTARTHPPHLVILDIMMPGVDGLEMCRRLRAADPRLPIILLTAKDAVADRVHGLEMGADDYLVKPFAVEELLARVHVQLRRHEPQQREILHYDNVKIDTGSRAVTRGERTLTLTSTEYQMLLFFMHHPEQVLERSVLLQRVWGYDFGGNDNVLEVYIGYLRNKLESEGEPRLIHTVRGVGYVLRQSQHAE